jgi:hypothetical protein
MALSDDGAYVLDARTQLAWSRCVEGMQWTGKNCAGTPSLLTHAEAMAVAIERGKARGLHWRVPRLGELQGLVPDGGAQRGLDARLFPEAPPGWHWTATTTIDSASVNQYNYANIARGRSEQNTNRVAFLHGWAVDPATGASRGDVSKRTKLAVRLVLSLD